jgi:hypothetical protein
LVIKSVYIFIVSTKTIASSSNPLLHPHRFQTRVFTSDRGVKTRVWGWKWVYIFGVTEFADRQWVFRRLFDGFDWLDDVDAWLEFWEMWGGECSPIEHRFVW